MWTRDGPKARARFSRTRHEFTIGGSRVMREQVTLIGAGITLHEAL
jgi:hypothetical protein